MKSFLLVFFFLTLALMAEGTQGVSITHTSTRHQSSIQIVRSIPTNATLLSKASFAIGASDATAPLLVRSELNGQSIVSGDLVTSTPVYTFYITEQGSGFSSGAIRLQRNDAAAETINFSASGNIGQAFPVTVTLSTASAEGAYSSRLQLTDIAGNTSEWQDLPMFVIHNSLTIENAINGPNPFNPNNEKTHVEYQLSLPAAVTIYVLSVSGRTLWSRTYSEGGDGGKSGFNSVEWDGRSSDGETLANGPYIAYLLAKHDRQTAKGKIKVLVLK
jgi:hypothetical protein